MVDYDFTDTQLFNALGHVECPNDAEMFVLTTAMLLAENATYTDIYDDELTLTESNVEAVARCFESTLAHFAGEFRGRGTIRGRLAEFVGLRVAGIKPERREYRASRN